MNDILIKSHEKSYFKYFHCNSPLAKSLFKENSDSVILQIMKVDNENFLAEIVSKDKIK